MMAGARSVAHYLGNHPRRHPARRAAAVLRRRPVAAHHRLPGRGSRGAAQLAAAARRVEGDRARARHRPHRGAAAVDPARRSSSWPAPIDRTPALHCQHRWAHAARHPRPPARPAATDPALPDVRPHRSLPRHLPAAGGARPPPRLDRQGHPRRRGAGAARGRQRNARPNEPGELVQRGALVAMGYWNDPERTAERFRPLPAAAPGREAGLVLPEIAVFSGDTVRRDEDGYLYFIGRRDEMIKTSGYRVSPTEVEEILYATGLVGECAACGLAASHPGPEHRRHRHPGPRPHARPRRPARRMPQPHAGLHGADARRAAQRPASAQRQRQDRPQDARRDALTEGRSA